MQGYWSTYHPEAKRERVLQRNRHICQFVMKIADEDTGTNDVGKCLYEIISQGQLIVIESSVSNKKVLSTELQGTSIKNLICHLLN